MNWLVNSTAFWALTGAGSAVVLEYVYRTMKAPFWSIWWLLIPANIAISYTVYRLVTMPSTTLVDAFIYWSFSTVVLRIFVSVVLLGDVVAIGTWVALGLLICARCAQHFIR